MIPGTAYTNYRYRYYDATSTATDAYGYTCEWVEIDMTEAQESAKLVGVLYDWLGLQFWLLKMVIGHPLPEHPLEPWHPPEVEKIDANDLVV